MKILRYSILFLIAYFLISLTVSRLFVIYLNNNINFLQDYINEQNISYVTVKNVETNWKGLYPSIKVEISNEAKGQKLKYPENIEVLVNIYKSVIFFKPILKSVYVEKINYTGELISLLAILNTNKNNMKFMVDNIIIANSKFNLLYQEKKYNFKNTNISIQKNNINFSSEFDNNKKINIKVKNILIDNNVLKNIDYKIEAKGEFNYEFKKLLKKYNIKIKNSKLLIKSSGKYRQGDFEESNFSIKTIKKSNFIINENSVKNINLKLAFSGNIKKKFNFEIIEFSSLSNNSNLYKFSNISGSYDFLNRTIFAYVHKMNINTKHFFNDYSFFDGNSFNFNGIISKAKFKLSITKNLNEIYFEGDLLNSNLLYKKNYVENFSGFVMFDNFQAYLDVSSKNIKISNDDILNNTLQFDLINGKLSLKNYNTLDVVFEKIKFVNKQIDFIVSGNVSSENNSINIFSSLKYIDMRYITDYLPKNFMKAKTANYFRNAFKEGKTNNGYITINGSLSSYPFYDDYSGISFAVFPIENLHMDYKTNWIPFKNINGKAYFNKRSAFFISENFKVLETNVRNPSLHIKDVKNAELLINVNLDGPLKDLITYSNKAKLSNINNKIIEKISGKASTDFDIILAFNGNKNFYESNINLIDINYDFNKSNKISNLNGKIKFKDNNFYTERNEILKGFYNSQKISFKLKTDSNKNFIISGKQKINFKDYIKNLNAKKLLTGNAVWKYEISFPGFSSPSKNIGIIASSNLEGTSVNLPEPFRKSENNKVSTKISTIFDQETFRDISISYNGMLSEIKSLNSLVGYIDFSGNKRNMPTQKFNLYGSISKININDWKDINTNSNDINLFAYLNKVNINIKRLSLNKVILDDLSIIGSSSDNSFSFEKIIVSSDKVNIKASGNIENNNISSFLINLKSENLQNLLNYWNFSHSIRDSSIDSIFDISWRGSLFDFKLKNIYGKFSTNMKDGRIKKVGNRVTRIFGLFNIDLLAKRLSLDFDDVTKNGFYFNTLDGDFRIDNGSIFTTNLFIKGPSAEMLAIGTTDIVNETYDMHVVASPEFGETLPAIALLGGPITAAATFAADKLAKAFGKDINDLIKIKYKVTGSWDNPIIKIMDKKTDPLDSVEELFE